MLKEDEREEVLCHVSSGKLSRSDGSPRTTSFTGLHCGASRQCFWNTLIQEQIEDLPQLKREDFCCAECTALQINLFMNEEGIAERVLAIPRLNKGNPIAPLISWVLLKPANDQDKPALIFTEANKSMEDVIEQAEGILKGGNIIPAENWPR